MTTYDDTIKALGGHYITDGEGTDYGTWTPNAVKTLIIAHDGVYVERHGRAKDELTRAATKPSSTSKPPLRALSHKQFGALETIVAPASIQITFRYFTRIKAVVIVSFSLILDKGYDSLHIFI